MVALAGTFTEEDRVALQHDTETVPASLGSIVDGTVAGWETPENGGEESREPPRDVQDLRSSCRRRYGTRQHDDDEDWDVSKDNGGVVIQNTVFL